MSSGTDAPAASATLKRLVWIERLSQREPELVETLKTFGELFQAKVQRLHHEDPALCWQDEGEWATDSAVIAQSPMNLTATVAAPHTGKVARPGRSRR